MEHCSKTGIGPSDRRPDWQPSRVPDCKERGKAGLRSQGESKRGRKRQVKGKRQRLQRERKRKRKAEGRRGEEDLLGSVPPIEERTYEVSSGMPKKRREGEDKRKEVGEKESPEGRRVSEGKAQPEEPLRMRKKKAENQKEKAMRGAVKDQKIMKERRGERAPLFVGQVGKTTIVRRKSKKRTSLTSEQRLSEKTSDRGRLDSLPFERVVLPGPAATGPGLFQCTGTASDMLQSDHLGVGRVCSEKVVAVGSEHPGWGLGDIVSWLDSRVDDLLGPLCKTLSTGRVFPLPSSPSFIDQLFPDHSEGARLVVRWLIRSLNSLNGEGIEGPEVASEYQLTVLRGLMVDCERGSKLEN